MAETDTTLLESLDQEIEQMAEPLVQKRQEVVNHRDNLIKEREQADDVLRKIDRVLKPLRPDLYKRADTDTRKKRRTGQARVGHRRSNGTATGFGITIEGCVPFVDEILKQTDGKKDLFVTQKGIYQEVPGGEQTKASAAFKYLRDIGFIRKGGYDSASRRERWYLDKPDTFQKELKRVEEEANA